MPPINYKKNEFTKNISYFWKTRFIRIKSSNTYRICSRVFIRRKKITVGLRANVSLLSEIAVYTYSEEVRLAEVFKAIAEKENEGPAISHKEDDATLKAYFREVLPEFDEDRVYTSDIKKVLNWYNLLQPKGMLTLEALAEKEPETTEKEEASE